MGRNYLCGSEKELQPFWLNIKDNIMYNLMRYYIMHDLLEYVMWKTRRYYHIKF